MREEFCYRIYYYQFPYHRVKKGSKIAIWGMGLVGRQYVAQLHGNPYCELVCCVDTNWKEVGADAPENILQKDIDAVVIAIASEEIAKDVVNRLRELGFEGEIIEECQDKSITSQKAILYQRIEHLNEEEAQKKYSYLTVEAWRKLKRVLRIFKVPGIGLERIGGMDDGGYVMLDDFDGRIAYSFGVGGDISWDQTMAEKGYEVYLYDHTVGDFQVENEKIHFFPIGLKDHTLPSENTETLVELLKKNGHEEDRHMILKMDIEGAEWGFLEMTSSEVLAQFDQITMELHGFMNDEGRGTAVRIPLLEKLCKTHCPVHIHANNIAKMVCVDGEPFVGTLEITFVNKETYHVEDAGDVSLPIALDKVNEIGAREFSLGNWNKQ